VTAIGGVYVIQSPSGKYRVGLTRNFRQRFYTYQSNARTFHLHKRPRENRHWLAAIRKYGWSAMRIGLLPLSYEQMEETEKLFIWLLKANNPKFGYNLTSGGEKSKILSLEMRHEMSRARMGKSTGKRGPCSASKANMKIRVELGLCTWQLNPNQARAARLSQKPYTAERRFQCGASTRGTHRSVEDKAKMSATLRLNLIGQRFGKWTVKELYAGERAPEKATKKNPLGSPRPHWLVQCDCGNFSHAPTANLTLGLSTQCRSCAGKRTKSPTDIQ